MTKADLVRIVSDETGIVRKDVALAIDAYLEAVKDAMRGGAHIELRGFGTYKLKKRKQRIGRNPKTEDEVIVPERIVPTFKFSRGFKKDVNKANKDMLE